MLRLSDIGMTKQFGNNLYPDSCVKASGSICVSGNMGVKRLVDTAKVLNNLEVGIDFFDGNQWELVVVLL